jgi:hypothetical protein
VWWRAHLARLGLLVDRAIPPQSIEWVRVRHSSTDGTFCGESSRARTGASERNNSQSGPVRRGVQNGPIPKKGIEGNAGDRHRSEERDPLGSVVAGVRSAAAVRSVRSTPNVPIPPPIASPFQRESHGDRSDPYPQDEARTRRLRNVTSLTTGARARCLRNPGRILEQSTHADPA